MRVHAKEAMQWPHLTQSLVPVADVSRAKITHYFLIVETNGAAHLRNGQFTETGIESNNIGGKSSIYPALHIKFWSLPHRAQHR